MDLRLNTEGSARTKKHETHSASRTTKYAPVVLAESSRNKGHGYARKFSDRSASRHDGLRARCD